MKEKEMGRGLREEKLKIFKDSEWYKFYQKNKKELILCIRNEYVNIYYRGMNIAKIQGRLTKARIHHKYLREPKKSKSNLYLSIEFEKLENKYEEIKRNVKQHIIDEGKREKEVQQNLMLQNNFNDKSKWICIDMEYDKERKSKDDGEKSGRYDILAISKKKNKEGKYRVALIELKVGQKAIAGSSRIKKTC